MSARHDPDDLRAVALGLGAGMGVIALVAAMLLLATCTPAHADDGFDDWAASAATQAVEWCESRDIPTVVGQAGERGVMQIHPVHRPLVAGLGYAWGDMFSTGPNLRVAYVLYQEHGWWPWYSCARWAGVL